MNVKPFTRTYCEPWQVDQSKQASENTIPISYIGLDITTVVATNTILSADCQWCRSSQTTRDTRLGIESK